MQQVRIDFDNPGLPQSLGVVEGESQSRIFQAALYKSGAAYTAPAGAVYSIMYRGFGPQNQGWYDTIEDGAGKRAACTVSGNVVTCELARQALHVPGHLTVVLCVSDAKGYMLKSWPIMADVRNDGYEDTVEVESFFYITQITSAEWTKAFAAWEDFKATIDPTLSLSGKAADAKATGAAVSKLEDKKADKTDLETERKRIDVLNEGGLNLKDEVIDTSIRAWLTEHPEATTTVQDGAITEKKINSEFLLYIKNNFVTPEMFGAVGDGVTDDTDPIQRAVDFGILKNMDVQFCSNYFVRNETIRVTGKCKLSGHGKIIKQPVEYSEGTVKAHNGAVFFVTGDNITIDGLSFESIKKYTPSLDVINSSTTDQKASNTSAINALNCSYLMVCNIKTKNMNPISINKVTNCIISSSYFNLAENGIYSDNSEAIISDCYFLMDNLKSVYYHALYIKNGSSITSNHCNFYVDGNDFYIGPLFAERTDEGLDKKSVVIIDSFEVVANCTRLYFAHDSKMFLLKNGTYINDRIRSTEDDIGKSYSGCNKIEISNCHFDVEGGYFDTSGVDTTIKDCEVIVHNLNASSLFSGGNISIMNCFVDIKIMVNGFVASPAYKTSLIGCEIRIGQGSLRFNIPNNLEILNVIGCIFERNDTANNSSYIFYGSDYSLYRVANNLFFGKIQKVYNESNPKVDNSFMNNIIN